MNKRTRIILGILGALLVIAGFGALITYPLTGFEIVPGNLTYSVYAYIAAAFVGALGIFFSTRIFSEMQTGINQEIDGQFSGDLKIVCPACGKSAFTERQKAKLALLRTLECPHCHARVGYPLWITITYLILVLIIGALALQYKVDSIVVGAVVILLIIAMMPIMVRTPFKVRSR
jgi:hypothetical protein